MSGYSSLLPLGSRVEEHSQSYAQPRINVPMNSTLTPSELTNRPPAPSHCTASAPFNPRTDSETMHDSSGSQLAGQGVDRERSYPSDHTAFLGGSQERGGFQERGGSQDRFSQEDRRQDFSIHPLNTHINLWQGSGQRQQQPNNDRGEYQMYPSNSDYGNYGPGGPGSRSNAGQMGMGGPSPDMNGMNRSAPQPYRPSSKPPPDKHKSLKKPEHVNSLAKRRGPMVRRGWCSESPYERLGCASASLHFNVSVFLAFYNAMCRACSFVLCDVWHILCWVFCLILSDHDPCKCFAQS